MIEKDLLTRHPAWEEIMTIEDWSMNMHITESRWIRRQIIKNRIDKEIQKLEQILATMGTFVHDEEIPRTRCTICKSIQDLKYIMKEYE